ncbi:PaaI family thioesterase [Mangrovicoccus algicola]|uniref:PaaI family thioesterase n=1 Tax=Mangrovicoccus algicola TaxID=2771008 RepID=A0A8J7D0H7_9RHOB|nr:PaaI family thioesterase [Mangrovicoccus algicola]MBE3639463.1 PaaI family thioesterase [Mangrovicoccus algicola]
MTPQIPQALRAFTEALPQARALGLQLEEAGAGRVVLSMPWAEELVGDPETGVIHGGAVSTLMDTCCAGAVVCHPDMAEAVTATLDLRIDYMRPAAPGKRILARAECYHVTRTVAFVRAQAWTEGDADRPVAMATAAFTALGRREAAP